MLLPFQVVFLLFLFSSLTVLSRTSEIILNNKGRVVLFLILEDMLPFSPLRMLFAVGLLFILYYVEVVSRAFVFLIINEC